MSSPHTSSHTFFSVSLYLSPFPGSSTREDGTRTLTSSWTTDVKDLKRSKAKSMPDLNAQKSPSKVGENQEIQVGKNCNGKRKKRKKVRIRVLSTRLEKETDIKFRGRQGHQQRSKRVVGLRVVLILSFFRLFPKERSAGCFTKSNRRTDRVEEISPECRQNCIFYCH